MELSRTTKIVTISITLLVTAVMIWLYHENMLASIYPDYAVEPFESHGVCVPNAPAPYIWPDTIGQ